MVALECAFKNEKIELALGFDEDEYGDDGEDGEGWTIFYSFNNASDEKLTIRILKTHLFSKSTIRERDFYLTGYGLNRFELYPKKEKTGADIYLEKSVNFEEGDKFYIKFEDVTNAEEYSLFFELVDYESGRFKCESSEINSKILKFERAFKNEKIELALGFKEDEYGDNGKDGEGWTIFYSFNNASDEKLTINILETHLFSKSTIRERDFYLTGYGLKRFELHPNTNKIGGDIYLKKYVYFDEGDKFYIKFEDVINAEEYSLFFELVDYESGTFKCASSEINKKPILNPKIFETELKNSIERLENLEEQIGMEIENLSVKLDGGELKILGDLFISNPEQYHSITLNSNYYDKDNNMIDKSYCTISLKDFLGFESFNISNYFSNPSEIDKIRLYPSINRR